MKGFLGFYVGRHTRGQCIERSNIKMAQALSLRTDEVRSLMLSMPFQKFEQRGYVTYDRKDLAFIRIDRRLWRQLTEQDLEAYTAALTRNGFFGPDSWYMNHKANGAYARRAPNGGKLTMPVLFLHGAYDVTCETMTSRLAEPMRRDCADLTEVVVPSGHWMAQEQPVAVNAALAKWLATKLPDYWKG